MGRAVRIVFKALPICIFLVFVLLTFQHLYDDGSFGLVISFVEHLLTRAYWSLQ